MNYLCITIRWLDERYHGQQADGESEWPPSPLRVFQSLVAAAASHWRGPQFADIARPAFHWLERLPLRTSGSTPRCGGPAIVAPPTRGGESFTRFVPNNDSDKLFDRQHRLTAKTVRPTHIVGGEEFPAVRYLWEVKDADKAGCEQHKETLFAAARSVVALGWGVDMAVGHGQMLDDAGVRALKGERWSPTAEGVTRLRVPVVGTFDALVGRHHDFLNRLQGDGFKPVPPLTAFHTVGYRRDTEPAPREWVAFRISSVDPDAPNPSFDTPGRARDVAAWVRHATAQACAEWPFPNFAAFVHGHTESGTQTKGEHADERFMYLPLPSIERQGERGEHVGAIRRVLVAAPVGFEDRVEWIRRRLAGHELEWGRDVPGVLLALPDSDWVLGRYIGPKQGARTWSTVTPVVLPGHDDRDPETAERLLRRAFGHAGFSEEVVRGLGLEWRNVGFRAGVDLASKYILPDRLGGPRYHVRVRFANPVRGPLAVGAGRYRGLGLFVAESN